MHAMESTAAILAVNPTTSGQTTRRGKALSYGQFILYEENHGLHAPRVAAKCSREYAIIVSVPPNTSSC